MRFANDMQRRAVFASMENRMSYPSKSVLSVPPKYVFDDLPKLSAKSDYEGIVRSLKKIEESDKYPAATREKARVERLRAEEILKDKFDESGGIRLPPLEYAEEPKQEAMVLTPKPEFDAAKEYEKLDEFLKKEGRDVEGYYAGTSLARYVPDPGAPSPAQEAAEEESSFREKVYKGLIKIVPKFKKRGEDFSRKSEPAADGVTDSDTGSCKKGDQRKQLKFGVTMDGDMVVSDREATKETGISKKGYQVILDK